MPDPEEIIFESPASDPDDKIWLEQGQKLLEGSFDAVHDAAKPFPFHLSRLQAMSYRCLTSHCFF